MAQGTRSKQSQSVHSEDLDTPSVTSAETEILQQRMLQRERQMREQAEQLAQQRADLERDREEPAYIRELLRKMESMENRIQILQDQVSVINRQQETTTRSVVPEREEPFELQSAREHLVQPRVNDVQPRRDPGSALESSPLRLKDVADAIPKYDGQRMSVFQFCQACERALKLIPPNQERYLVQLVMGRLQGHAYTIMQDSSHSTIEPLLRKLKQVFGPNKSLNQYRGELGNIYMRPNESILDYITRIKELQTAIIDAEVALRGVELDTVTRYSIDRDVLESFINGLPSDLLVRIKVEGYTTLYLDDAFARAIQLSKTLETETLRKRHSFNPPPAKFPRYDTPMPRRDAPQQQYSTRPQYSIQARSNAPFIKPLVPGQLGPNAPRQTICFYCKIPGHIMSECRKKAFNEKQAAQTRRDKEPIPSTSRGIAPGNEGRVPTDTSVRRDTPLQGRQVAIASQENARLEPPR